MQPGVNLIHHQWINTTTTLKTNVASVKRERILVTGTYVGEFWICWIIGVCVQSQSHCSIPHRDLQLQSRSSRPQTMSIVNHMTVQMRWNVCFMSVCRYAFYYGGMLVICPVFKPRSGAVDIEDMSDMRCREIPTIINRNLIGITIFGRCIG